MVDRLPLSGRTILLADRNYESRNNLAPLEKKGWKYAIRIREKDRATVFGVKLPGQPEFDIPVRITLGRLTRRQLEQRGRRVPEPFTASHPA